MKVALVGSAPSSAALAPYDDPEWSIWACSPGAVPFVKRVDMWFELHRWGQDWLTDDYRAHLAGLTCPVQMIDLVDDVPTSVKFPVDDLVYSFGRHFFTSSPAWMLAYALSLDAREIGLWGIDMASDDEYAQQKPGCQHFIHLARQRGVLVTIPPQSDLDRPPPLYGVSEADPMMVKLLSRQAELKARIATADQHIEHYTREKLYLTGAEENLRYVMQTWA